MEAVAAAGFECMTAGGKVVDFDGSESDNTSATSELITIGSTQIHGLPAGDIDGFCFDVTTSGACPLAISGNTCDIKRLRASSCRSMRSMLLPLTPAALLSGGPHSRRRYHNTPNDGLCAWKSVSSITKFQTRAMKEEKLKKERTAASGEAPAVHVDQVPRALSANLQTLRRSTPAAVSHPGGAGHHRRCVGGGHGHSDRPPNRELAKVHGFGI